MILAAVRRVHGEQCHVTSETGCDAETGCVPMPPPTSIKTVLCVESVQREWALSGVARRLISRTTITVYMHTREVATVAMHLVDHKGERSSSVTTNCGNSKGTRGAHLGYCVLLSWQESKARRGDGE